MIHKIKNGIQICMVSLVIAASCFASQAIAAASDEIITFADGKTPAQEIHVATDGSDDHGDGSSESPYATIRFAVSLAVPGTAVKIHPGVYPGGIYMNAVAGNSSSPIWIGGADKENPPVIRGGNTGIQFSRAKYLVMHNFTVEQSRDNGLNFDDGGDVSDPLASHHIVFRKLTVRNIGGTGNQDGLKLSGINDFFVIDSSFSFCGGAGSGSGIDHVGCHRGLIARNSFTSLSGNAVQVKGGSEDIEIRGCIIKNAGERGINIGGSTGLQYFRPPLSTTNPNAEARNVRVLSNVFEGSVTPMAFVGAVDSVASNNTVINPTSWLLRILQETVSGSGYSFLPCGNNTFRNNLLYFKRSQIRTHINIGGNTAPGTFSFANNLWFAHDNPSASKPALPVVETNGIYGQNSLMTNPAAGDFRITDSSPAFHAGFAPALTEGDIAGVRYAEQPSIGAYEVPAPCDIDGNGSTDADDLAIIAASFGKNTVDGDFDQDGDTDGEDLARFSGCL